jgi:hypothetical protein
MDEVVFFAFALLKGQNGMPTLIEEKFTLCPNGEESGVMKVERRESPLRTVTRRRTCNIYCCFMRVRTAGKT